MFVVIEGVKICISEYAELVKLTSGAKQGF
ncbi:hypothetical protein [Acinetobacter phage Ab69]|nr:hypothetical protein [Acinetobacter phage Ab69]